MPLPPLVEPVDALDEAERARTARHASLAGFGELAQRRLAAAHVAVVGAGGLGSPVVLALAAAGVGTLTVIDDDVVEASNLQRQVMHRVQDVGAPKVDSAVRVAADLSPETVVRPVRAWLTADNARDLLAGADLVIDGTDTFETREAVASAVRGPRRAAGVGRRAGVPRAGHGVLVGAARRRRRPCAWRTSTRTRASATCRPARRWACSARSACRSARSSRPRPIKLVTGIGEPLLGRVLVIDALRGRTDEVPLRADASAPPLRAETARRDAIAHVDAAAATRRRSPPARRSSTCASRTRRRDGHDPRRHARSRSAECSPIPSRAGSGPVVVVCKVGARALRAAEALRGAGIEASVLTGGMDAWDAASRRG